MRIIHFNALSCFTGALLLAFLGLAPSLRAQMKYCTGLSSAKGYKILVDEVEYSGNTPDSSRPAKPLELLRFAVASSVERARLQAEGKSRSALNFSILPCAGRHPSGDSDFDRQIIEQLSQDHAILEIWGTIYPLDAGKHRMIFQYVLVPVSFLKPPPPQGIIRRDREMPVRPSTDQVLSFFDERAQDLKAYYMIATGVQTHADRQWSSALRFLCKGVSLLKGKPEHVELIHYAEVLAASAAEEVRKIKGQSLDLLTSGQANDYCTFAMTR